MTVSGPHAGEGPQFLCEVAALILCRPVCSSPYPFYWKGDWQGRVAGFSWACPHNVSACVLLVNILKELNFCLCMSLGPLKHQPNSRLFPPQITVISTSRWPETGVVATHLQLRALHTCGQEPVPAMGSEGAVCALRWRWVGTTEGIGAESRFILWNSLPSATLARPQY